MCVCVFAFCCHSPNNAFGISNEQHVFAYTSFEMSDFSLYPDLMFFSYGCLRLVESLSHTLWQTRGPLVSFILVPDPFGNSDRTLMLMIAIYVILTLFL